DQESCGRWGGGKNPLATAKQIANRVSGGGRGRSRQEGADRHARRAVGRKRTPCTLTTGGPSTWRDAPSSRDRERGGILGHRGYNLFNPSSAATLNASARVG